MKLVDWVEEIRATGGVEDCGYDTLAAIRSASTLCWAEIDRMGRSRDETAQLGIKWVAAFMVSCAKHGATDICSILVPSRHRRDIFCAEAERNYGVLESILTEAASTSRKEFDIALWAAGAHWTIALSERWSQEFGPVAKLWRLTKD